MRPIVLVREVDTIKLRKSYNNHKIFNIKKLEGFYKTNSFKPTPPADSLWVTPDKLKVFGVGNVYKFQAD